MKTNKQIPRKELADFKRLVECCIANPVWCKEFLAQPQKWLEQRGLYLNVELAVDAIRKQNGAKENKTENLYLREMQKLIDYVHADIKEKVEPEKMPNDSFRKWYIRNSQRYFFTSVASRLLSSGFYHIPFAFELNAGCSVGCPFCGFAAEKLTKVCRYTKETSDCWKEILEISKTVAGDMAGIGVCYMATEPFDNPDYELFLRDYKDVFGRYPQTTTAVAHRQVKRIKAFMEELGDGALSLAAMRFSITSLEQLESIYQSYTSEELLYVELLMNNPESNLSYSKAGRSVELMSKLSGKRFEEELSIACNCGFLVNLAEKTIVLNIPHRPDREHANGIKIYERRQFENAQDYKKVLMSMIEKWMPKSLPLDCSFALPPRVSYYRKGYILTLRGDRVSRSISVSDKEYQWFLDLIENGISLNNLYQIEEANEFEKMQLEKKLSILFDVGCIEEVKILAM